MGEAAAPTSLYRKVADDLRAAIAAAEYPAGARLPRFPALPWPAFRRWAA